METNPSCYEDIRLSQSDSKWQKREMVWIVKWSSQTTKPIHKLQAWQLNSTKFDRRPQNYATTMPLSCWTLPAGMVCLTCCERNGTSMSVALDTLGCRRCEEWRTTLNPTRRFCVFMALPSRAPCSCGKSMKEIAGIGFQLHIPAWEIQLQTDAKLCSYWWSDERERVKTGVNREDEIFAFSFLGFNSHWRWLSWPYVIENYKKL